MKISPPERAIVERLIELTNVTPFPTEECVSGYAVYDTERKGVYFVTVRTYHNTPFGTYTSASCGCTHGNDTCNHLMSVVMTHFQPTEVA